jgi:hypothetical protein
MFTTITRAAWLPKKIGGWVVVTRDSGSIITTIARESMALQGDFTPFLAKGAKSRVRANPDHG